MQCLYKVDVLFKKGIIMSQYLLDNGLTLEEEVQLISLIGKVNPKKMGTKLFDAIASKTVSVAIEAVCIRYKPFHNEDLGIDSRKLQVYMTQRLFYDTAYPGEWHCPGSVMHPGEHFYGAIDRLNKNEFSGMMFPNQFVANVNNPNEKRGHFLSIVYLCQFRGDESDRGKWFDINNLPEITVYHHRSRIIPAALGMFVANKSET